MEAARSKGQGGRRNRRSRCCLWGRGLRLHGRGAGLGRGGGEGVLICGSWVSSLPRNSRGVGVVLGRGGLFRVRQGGIGRCRGGFAPPEAERGQGPAQGHQPCTRCGDSESLPQDLGQCELVALSVVTGSRANQ